MSIELAPTISGAPVRRWKRYPVYRDSEVEWLGEIPEGWKIKALKRTFKTLNGSTPKSGKSDYWDGDIHWATPDDLGQLKCNILQTTQRMITKDGYNSCGTSLAPSGSLVLSTRAPIGHLAIAGTTMCTNQGCRCLVFRVDDDSYYFYYQLLAARSELESLGQGSTFKELSRGNLEAAYITTPPLPEQHAIAAFLDHKTGRIDTLIEKKERQVELLQEKRAVLISHTVTKGLDPDAPMKDSGVEWLGKIPEHWEISPLRGVLLQRGEYNLGPRTTNILSVVKDVGVINYDERKASGNKKSDDVEQYKIIHKGDIVVNRMNVIIGSVGVAREFGAASIEYYVLHAKDSSVYAEYYGHIFSSKMFQKNLGRLGSGILGHRLRIPFEVLKTEMLPKPPYSEQQDIANALNDERKRIDIFTKKVQESIFILREYRTALISAAVTGKIDVRVDLVS